MNLIGKLIIAVAIAGACYGIHFFAPELHLAILFLTASIATALLTSITPAAPASSTETPAPASKKARSEAPTQAASGPREEGEVKWFNVSKGFGFITKDNGEEIFVHFRSIRGEGRRGLRDGQRVSFVEAQSDKGPQAEDVEGL